MKPIVSDTGKNQSGLFVIFVVVDSTSAGNGRGKKGKNTLIKKNKTKKKQASGGKQGRSAHFLLVENVITYYGCDAANIHLRRDLLVHVVLS